jgi:hypothetical protein
MDHKFNRHEYFSGLLLQIKYDAFRFLSIVSIRSPVPLEESIGYK